MMDNIEVVYYFNFIVFYHINHPESLKFYIFSHIGTGNGFLFLPPMGKYCPSVLNMP
jgi:hypothetical protein